ncbi:MAG TPA: DUF1499 domain-containing protein [Longimicrobiales bacterium]|nr:DUF1499 domain-containing protein [Longimicrobiales bacterium]
MAEVVVVRRPRISPLALLALGLAVLSALAVVLAGLGTRWGWWRFTTGFVVLRYGFYGAGLALLLGIVAVVRTRPGSGRRGLLVAVLALLGGGVVTGELVRWLARARSAPPIHDITTDMVDPPAFVAILPLRAQAANAAEYGGAAVAQRQQAAYPDVQPVILMEPPAKALADAAAVAREMGWETVAVDSAGGRLEATATTRWFGFKDDVVVRVRPVGTGSRVDVRSVSRVGRGDVGTNARRVREFMELLKRRAGA